MSQTLAACPTTTLPRRCDNGLELLSLVASKEENQDNDEECLFAPSFPRSLPFKKRILPPLTMQTRGAVKKPRHLDCIQTNLPTIPLSATSTTTTTKASTMSASGAMDEDELFVRLAFGEFRNIVILTGAGISTAAGIPDFRSPGTGLFARLREQFGQRFPEAAVDPEVLLSRSFLDEHPVVWKEEVWPVAQLDLIGAKPTETHRFCAWLEQQGWLKRIYTQNIDGLHTHPSLLEQVPSLGRDSKVVECHGSLAQNAESLVMYEDDLPEAFYQACEEDFASPAEEGGDEEEDDTAVDLLLVFGTSLQVSPFCAVPNLAPKNCVRVLVNRNLQDCCGGNHHRRRRHHGGQKTANFGPSHPAVTLKSYWSLPSTNNNNRNRSSNNLPQKRHWRQLLVQGDCDDFCRRFFASESSRVLGHQPLTTATAVGPT